MGLVNPPSLQVGMLTGFILHGSWVGNHSCWGFISVVSNSIMSRWKCLIQFFPSQALAFIIFLSPLLILFTSLHFKLSCVSMFTTIHCTMKLLWWYLRATLVYRYRIMNLESRFILHPFSKCILAGSCMGPISSPPWVLHLQYQAYISSHGPGFKSNQRVVD